MNVVIRKIGNSEGIIIPKDVLDRLGLKAGDSVELREDGANLTLIPEQADFAEQMKAARLGMRKYHAALKELAK